MTKRESIKNRRIQRRKKKVLAARMTKGAVAAAALSLTMAGGAVEAATITVNPPSCSLIDAINSANTDSAAGGCSAGSGADTIVLPAGSTTTLTVVDNDTYKDTGLPVVSSEVTIQGNGSVIERDETAPPFSIFAVSNTGNLTLEEVTVRNALLSGYYSYPGIKNKLASMKQDAKSRHRDGNPANHKELKSNFLKAAQGLGYSWGSGVVNYYGLLTVTNSTISGNYGIIGAGILNGGALTVTNSAISGNYAYFEGGGIANIGDLTIDQSTLSDNVAYWLGGGMEDYGTSTVTNSTFSGNRAVSGNGYGYGGAFETWGGSTILRNCTITANNADYGGGISSWGTGVVNLTGTIVSGNHDNNCYVYEGATLTDNGHNWFGDATCSGAAQGDPLLGPLADNGGPTLTHALLTGSGAIDSAGATCGLTKDQRGEPRPVDGNNDGVAACDIGAYERAAPRHEIASVPAPAMSLGGIAAFIAGLFGVSIWGRRRKDI